MYPLSNMKVVSLFTRIPRKILASTLRSEMVQNCLIPVEFSSSGMKYSSATNQSLARKFFLHATLSSFQSRFLSLSQYLYTLYGMPLAWLFSVLLEKDVDFLPAWFLYFEGKSWFSWFDKSLHLLLPRSFDMYLNGFLVKSTLPFNRRFLSLRWHSEDLNALPQVVSNFCEYWIHNGIILVSQLFNKEGHTFTYDEVFWEYNIPLPLREFAVVLDAIPSGLNLLLCSVSKDTNHIHATQLFIGNSDPFLSTKTNNKHIWEIIKWGTISRRASVFSFFWNNLYSNIDCGKKHGCYLEFFLCVKQSLRGDFFQQICWTKTKAHGLQILFDFLPGLNKILHES